jgi:hypothetical protein
MHGCRLVTELQGRTGPAGLHSSARVRKGIMNVSMVFAGHVAAVSARCCSWHGLMGGAGTAGWLPCCFVCVEVARAVAVTPHCNNSVQAAEDKLL